MKSVLFPAFAAARLMYPAESLAAVVPKPLQGLLLIAFYAAVFILLIAFMLRCGKKKPKH